MKEGMKGKASVKFFKDEPDGRIVEFGGGEGWFFLGNERSDMWCVDLSEGFEGIEDTTLTGKTGDYMGPYHHCCRLVAIQLE